MKKANGFLKRDDELSIKTAKAYLNKIVVLLKEKGFDVDKKPYLHKKQTEHKDGEMYFCQYTLCPTKGVQHRFETMIVKNGFIYCSDPCANATI